MRKKYRGSISWVADAARLPFRDGSFDGVFHFFVFDHVPEWKTAIREVYRVLKCGGLYAFEEGLIPDKPWFLNSLFGHVTITAEALRAALADTGFEVNRFEIGAFSIPVFVRALKG